MPLTSGLSSSFGTVLLATLFGGTIASNTQYVCKFINAATTKYCELSSNGGFCSPSAHGLPPGEIFSTSIQGSGTFSEIRYECIGFSNFDLVSGGGSCIMNCPDTCEVTQNVAFPCSDNSGSSIFAGGSVFGDGSSSGGGTTEDISTLFGNTGESSTTGSGGTTSTTTTEGSTIVSGGTDVSGTTEFVCNSGSHCTLSSTGGICSPIVKGLPPLTNYMPVLMNDASTKVNYECIGLANTDLVSGGGHCQMSCPDSCTVTQDVSNPCNSGGDDGDNPANLHAVSTIIAVIVAVGAAGVYH